MKKIFLLLLVFLTACSASENENREQKGKVLRQNQKYEEIEITIGEATTTIIDTGKNRVSNIKKACESVSGSIVYPEKEFSFNKKTGPRSRENGYKNAPVIVDGEKSYGIGGGVCQVSTTVYMAALNANLAITEHHNHSEAVMYAPDGKDATVVYGAKDFKFKNNTNNTLYIYVWVQENKVISKIVQKTVEVME